MPSPVSTTAAFTSASSGRETPPPPVAVRVKGVSAKAVNAARGGGGLLLGRREEVKGLGSSPRAGRGDVAAKAESGVAQRQRLRVGGAGGGGLPQ